MHTTMPQFTCKFFALLPEDENATMMAETKEIVFINGRRTGKNTNKEHVASRNQYGILPNSLFKIPQYLNYYLIIVAVLVKQMFLLRYFTAVKQYEVVVVGRIHGGKSSSLTVFK